jgi:hypothetical protein
MSIDHHPRPDNQTSRLGNHEWSVSRLFELSRNLEVMTIPLKHMNMYYKYENMTLRELAGHMVAVNNADLKYPIILDEDGEIMDGRHRLLKAIIEGKRTIKAVRFKKNPRPCKVLND